MGTVKVTNIEPIADNGTVTLGGSGDTITVPTGVTTTLTDGVSGDFKMNSGYGSVATAYGVRAWVNFNGTGTPSIRASGNVSSITDNGGGDHTVNFSSSMPDANYSVVTGVNSYNQGDGDNRFVLTVSSIGSSSVRLVRTAVQNGFSKIDGNYNYIAILR